MKGLALETIAYMFIAIVAILLIITLVSGKIGPAARSAYCTFIKGLKSILPLPAHLKTPLPAYCQEDTIDGVETHEIIANDPDRIARDIAAYALACWEKTGKVNMGQDILCYELLIRDIVGSVTETDVLLVLEANNYEDLPLDWRAGIIDTTKSISVGYNSTLKEIIIQ